MLLSPLHKLGPVLAVIAALGSSASAQEAEKPLLQNLPSAFEGFGWRISNVPLDVNFPTAMQAVNPSLRLKLRRWTANYGRGNVLPVDEFESIGFNITDVQGVKDRTTVTPTHWHSGQMIWRVDKTVKSNKPELMPTAADLEAAIIAEFGADPVDSQKDFGARGLGKGSYKILAYPVKDGARFSGPCFDPTTSLYRSTAKPQAKYQVVKDMEDKIENGGYCEAVLMVLYAEGRMGRLSEYRIVARDFLMEARHMIHDLETRVRLLEAERNNLPSVQPKL
ncbi:hypothetical protein [uncultured Roseobacter sp.]|uniref:hypothetical protein n=1 Tax=uncultured Roseobacter sp. TaxID=114847 RepID=UPI002624369C|nr:hypothetical protein [uncultured Roseobacter sp.]